MPFKVTGSDIAEHLNGEEDIHSSRLPSRKAIRCSSPNASASWLGRQNMSRFARDVGMSRASPYKALSGEKNPEFATILKVMKSLGLELIRF